MIRIELYCIILSLIVTLSFSQNDSVTNTNSVELDNVKMKLVNMQAQLDTLKLLISELRTLHIETTKNDSISVNNNPQSDITTVIKSQYWLSKSGVRHNKKCRFYESKSGHACSKSEGTACKRCGG